MSIARLPAAAPKIEHLDEALAARPGQILMTNAPARRAGWA
jgi:hypothetical protein